MNGKIWAWVRTLLGAGIIALLIWRLGSVAFVDGLRVINVWVVLAALGIGLMTTFFSAWRWLLTSRGLGIRLPLHRAVADYYQALFLNATLPGGLLGDVDRAVRNGKGAGSVGRGVRAVVLERTAGQIMLFSVGAFVLLAHPSRVLAEAHVLSIPREGVLGVAVVGLAVAIFVGFRLRHRTSRWRRAFAAGVSDVRLGLLSRRNWPGIVISSALVLAGHLATFVLAARAAGSSAPIARLLPLMVLALLVMGLPVNVGGWGPREGFCAWAFGAAGLGATQGLTVAVVYGVLAFVASAPGIAVLIVRLIAKRAPARAAARAEALAPAEAPAPALVADVAPVAPEAPKPSRSLGDILSTPPWPTDRVPSRGVLVATSAGHEEITW
jgi:uncharacterized membrane protein YbhN (UPF0104 family)